MNNISCPLCGFVADDYYEDSCRRYFQCRDCRLVFVDPQDFLSASEEKRQYDFHQNSPADAGYRKFLSRMSVPMRELLSIGDCGLDFGCGPGPTLSLMFAELGCPMKIYDPIYAAEESVLGVEYDFITATEVAEHFCRPDQSFAKIMKCLKPGGYLGIMTKLVIDQEAFAKWHYKDDPTHVSFFSDETFDWLAAHWQMSVVFRKNDVIILKNK
jgi:SAM-dependent methyltransferase